jgi:hypothetical protein
MDCINCHEPIEFYSPTGRRTSGYWLHPDLVDYDCHGTWCAEGEEEAEPT